MLEGSPSIPSEPPPQSPSYYDVASAAAHGASRRACARRDLDVRRGDDEAVHAMRVASRRLRSCLRTFAPELPPGCLELSDELQWLALCTRPSAGCAGHAPPRLQRDATKLLSPFAIASVRAVLDAHLDIELREATTALDEVLQSDRYRSLLQTLDEYIGRLGTCNRRGAGLLKYVKREAGHARREIAASQRATGPRRDVKIHGARKAASALVTPPRRWSPSRAKAPNASPTASRRSRSFSATGRTLWSFARSSGLCRRRPTTDRGCRRLRCRNRSNSSPTQRSQRSGRSTPLSSTFEVTRRRLGCSALSTR